MSKARGGGVVAWQFCSVQGWWSVFGKRLVIGVVSLALLSVGPPVLVV
ncbi:hypothetical protein ABZW96_24320 [Nocardia sp. NPDC004168]|nr:hypothetical protein [Nocardia sputorum]BDT91516.1 hypothetical protein IFM12275_14920 [Nocardia sputorum]